MRNLHFTQQSVFFIYECHANTGPGEIAAKVFDTCNKHITAVKEIRQITDTRTLTYQRYPTVLYIVKMSQFDNGNPSIHWRVPELPSDEFIIPTRIAFETSDGRDLRQGRFPGIVETNTTSNGCYNSDKSKSSIPLTIKYQTESSLQRLKVRETIEGLLKETSGLQDTQFQIKEGIDWRRLCKFQEVATFTVMSVRHLNDQERVALATELMAYRIKYFFLSKAQVVLQLEGTDVEVLRNLLIVRRLTSHLDSGNSLLKFCSAKSHMLMQMPTKWK